MFLFHLLLFEKHGVSFYSMLMSL